MRPPLDTAPEPLREGLVALDEAGRCTGASPRAGELLGRVPAELVGVPLADALGAGWSEALEPAMREALRGAAADAVELRHAPTGRWLAVRLHPRPGGAHAVLEDATRARAAEEALERQRVIFETLYDAVLATDADGRITACNPAAEQAFGYPADELIGRTPDLLLRNEAQMRRMLDVISRDGEWVGETRLTRGDGVPRLFETRVRAIRDADGALAATVGVNHDVTDQRTAERAHRALLAAMTDPVFVIDREGRHLRVASSGGEQLYVPPERILGHTIHELLPAGVADHLHAAVVRALDERRTTEVEYSLEIRGEPHHFLASVSPMDDQRVVWVARDFTERHRAEERLRAVNQQLRTFLDTIPDEAWMKDREGRYRTANESYLAAWDRTREEIVGRTDADLFPPDVARVFAESDREVLASRTRLDFEHQHRDPRTGILHWHEVVKAPLLGPDGEVSGVVGISRDITHRKQAEEALRETEERFRQLAENIPQAFWIADTVSGRVLYVSPAFASICQVPVEAVLRGERPWTERVHPEDRERVIRTFRNGMSRGVSYEQVYRILTPGGDVRWVHDRGFPVLGPEGTVYRYAGVAEDISAQRRIELELERQALLFQATTDAVIYTDLHGRITEWNDGARRIFGFGPGEAVGRTLPELLAPGADAGPWGESPERLRRDGVWTGEQTARRSDGSEAVCDVTMLPVLRGDALEGAISIARDITERRSLEEQLRQSQKLEGVGRLAGGIAHDFNNMLLAIQGFATLLRREIPPDGEAAEYLGEILAAAERSARLTRQLLAYSRRQILRAETLDLGEVAASLESMLRRMIGEDVELAVEADPELPPVQADRSQVEQVLLNLVVNARDAMPEGGRVVVRTRARTVDENDRAGWPAAVVAGRYAEICVEDTGVGMTGEVLAVAFDPFFTTKPVGEGTGLGLSTVYGVVKQSGGHVWAESVPGDGTRVRVLLPAVDAAPEEAAAVAAEEAPGTPGASGAAVLVVEDEPSVRRLLTLVLQGDGYRVVAAANGTEARRALEAHAGELAVALIDVVLPGESGRVIAEQVRALRPETHIVFMSGYTDDALLRHGIEAAEHRFLQKPIHPSVLLQQVRELVE